MATIELRAQPRSLIGRKVRQLRRQGLVPAVVYGRNTPTLTIQVEENALERVLRRAGFTHLINLQIESDGSPVSAMVLVREVQRHPIRRNLLHVDFYRVVMTEKLRVEVPIRLVGEAPVVATGAMLIQNLDAIEVECLPADIPEVIQVDVSGLTDPSQSISVADLVVPPKVTVLSDPKAVVVSVAYAAGEEEVEEAEEEMAEPEVMAKGKAAKAEEMPEE
ncbi:MAG: 50S ribosomal protein L25 [Anaerolineae bacterium]|nr:50S ribosomal protein L25 [Anaerolineae bacterium]MDW8100576.1 50S ribosomal protein L25 [Anaerolineae bacterium]